MSLTQSFTRFWCSTLQPALHKACVTLSRSSRHATWIGVSPVCHNDNIIVIMRIITVAYRPVHHSKIAIFPAPAVHRLCRSFENRIIQKLIGLPTVLIVVRSSIVTCLVVTSVNLWLYSRSHWPINGWCYLFTVSSSRILFLHVAGSRFPSYALSLSALQRNSFLLWPWTLTYDLDLQTLRG